MGENQSFFEYILLTEGVFKIVKIQGQTQSMLPQSYATDKSDVSTTCRIDIDNGEEDVQTLWLSYH